MLDAVVLDTRIKTVSKALEDVTVFKYLGMSLTNQSDVYKEGKSK